MEEYSRLERTRASNAKIEARVLRNQHFYIHHSKGFRETVYFLGKITITMRTYSERTNQLYLRVHNLSEVKF